MREFEVLHPGVLSLIQDDGRPGLAFYGIPGSGHLDPDSAHRTNLVVGNPSSAPVIECHLVAPRLLFRDALDFTVTGADFDWRVDGEPIERGRVVRAAGGSVLSGTGGQLDCRRDHGSAATYTYGGLGGLDGRPLVRGDVIRVSPLGNSPDVSGGELRSHNRSHDAAELLTVGILPGPEWNVLTGEARRMLLSGRFSIDMNSDRMGARLGGTTLSVRPSAKMATVPLLPGTMQIPGSGAPIVVLADGQTTGGYPRVAVLPCVELGRFNQIPPGRMFGFRRLR